MDPPELECPRQFVSQIPFSKILYSIICQDYLKTAVSHCVPKFISKQEILTWREELTEREKRMEEKEEWYRINLLLLEPNAMQAKIWQITGFEYKMNEYDRVSSNLHVK